MKIAISNLPIKTTFDYTKSLPRPEGLSRDCGGSCTFLNYHSFCGTADSVRSNIRKAASAARKTLGGPARPVLRWAASAAFCGMSVTEGGRERRQTSCEEQRLYRVAAGKHKGLLHDRSAVSRYLPRNSRCPSPPCFGSGAQLAFPPSLAEACARHLPDDRHSCSAGRLRVYPAAPRRPLSPTHWAFPARSITRYLSALSCCLASCCASRGRRHPLPWEEGAVCCCGNWRVSRQQ